MGWKNSGKNLKGLSRGPEEVQKLLDEAVAPAVRQAQATHEQSLERLRKGWERRFQETFGQQGAVQGAFPEVGRVRGRKDGGKRLEGLTRGPEEVQKLLDEASSHAVRQAQATHEQSLERLRKGWERRFRETDLIPFFRTTPD